MLVSFAHTCFEHMNILFIAALLSSQPTFYPAVCGTTSHHTDEPIDIYLH